MGEDGPRGEDVARPTVEDRGSSSPLRFGRRELLVSLGGSVLATLLWRTHGYSRLVDWRGRCLDVREAEVLLAATEVLVPDVDAPVLRSIPQRVDTYLSGVAPSTLREIHLLFTLVEQLPFMLGDLGVGLGRFSHAEAVARAQLLEGASNLGDVRWQIYKGLRDLCLLGYYQQPAVWQSIGYAGPVVAGGASLAARDNPLAARYEALKAPVGRLPTGAER